MEPLNRNFRCYLADLFAMQMQIVESEWMSGRQSRLPPLGGVARQTHSSERRFKQVVEACALNRNCGVETPEESRRSTCQAKRSKFSL